MIEVHVVFGFLVIKYLNVNLSASGAGCKAADSRVGSSVLSVLYCGSCVDGLACQRSEFVSLP